MTGYATKRDLRNLSKELSDKIDAKITSAVDDLAEIIGQFSARVDERFNRVEGRVGNLENTLDTFLKRLDDMEVDNAARDMQLARHEAWIKPASS